MIDLDHRRDKRHAQEPASTDRVGSAPWHRWAGCARRICERMSDLIDIGACGASERLAVAGIIVDSAKDPSDYAIALPTIQRGIDRRTSPQIGEVRLRECPPPSIAIDPAKYLLFSGLLHFASPPLQEKIPHFSCKRTAWRWILESAHQSARWYLYRRAASASLSVRCGRIVPLFVPVPPWARA